MNKTKYVEVNCNQMDYVRDGMHVVGDCGILASSPFSVTGNLMAYNNNQTGTVGYGMLFRHLGSEGSFGDIGDVQHDNNNIFNGISNYTSGYKVYKLCIAPIFDKIFTKSITLAVPESGSNNGCEYQPLSNNFAHEEWDCNADSYIQAFGLKTQYALQIAQDSVDYSEYFDVADWMDENELYTRLARDIVLRNSNPLFLMFYNSRQAGALDEIVETDDIIMSLVDSLTGMDSTLYNQLLADAEARNSSIISATIYEENERTINAVYLKVLRFGVGSFDADDAAQIRDLAFQCPYIGGPSVYKARNLYAIYEPGLYYDDLRICNNAGVYKNGKGLFDEEDLLINSVSKSAINKFNKDEFVIYPNPAETQLSIKYTLTNQQNVQFILSDILGREVKKVELPYTSNIVTLLVNDLIPGVYTYKQICNGVQTRTGKVVIEK